MREVQNISEITCLKHAMRLSDENCKMLLRKMRWNDKPICPKCGSEKHYYLKSRDTYKCANRDCYKQFTVTTGTIFHSTKMPLSDWFAAMWLFSSEARGISSVQLAKHLKIEQKTAWFVLQRIRQAVNDANGFVLSGTVEVDEAFCGARLSRDKRKAWKVEMQRQKRVGLRAEGPEEKAARLRKESKKTEAGNYVPVYPELYLDMLSKLPTGQRQLFENDNYRRAMYQPHFYSKVILGLRERDEYDYIINPDGSYKVVRTKIGKIRLIKLGRHDGEVNSEKIVPLLKQMITQDSRIMTDSHPAYTKELGEHFHRHDKVVHSGQKPEKEIEADENNEKKSGTLFNELNSTVLKSKKKKKKASRKASVKYVDGDKHTNTIENNWLHFKKMENGTYFHFSWKYTERYLDEYAFRFNTRYSQDFERFEELFSGAFSNKITLKNLQALDDSYSFVPR